MLLTSVLHTIKHVSRLGVFQSSCRDLSVDDRGGSAIVSLHDQMLVGAYAGRVVSQQGKHAIPWVEAFLSSRFAERVELLGEIGRVRRRCLARPDERLVESNGLEVAHTLFICRCPNIRADGLARVVEDCKFDAFLSPMDLDWRIHPDFLNDP